MSSKTQPRKKLVIQSTLHDFLGLEDYRAPCVFHLDFETKKAQFLSKTPPLSSKKWSQSFYWKQESRELIVCIIFCFFFEKDYYKLYILTT